MLRSFLVHLRAQWAGFLALFLVIAGGTAYAANTVFSEDIVDGEVKAADIGSNAVRTTKIGAGQVTQSDLAGDAVDGSKVLDASINNADLTDGAVNSAKVLNGSIANADLGIDSVQAIQIADDTIDGGEIINDSLGSADLAPNSIGASELGDNSVASANVVQNSLTTADLAGTDASGAITLGSGAVGNGRCRTFDISVPGAVTGQGVIISTKATTQAGIMIYGQRVPSADTVAMVVCNLSGTTMTGFTNLPIRTITFG